MLTIIYPQSTQQPQTQTSNRELPYSVWKSAVENPFCMSPQCIMASQGWSSAQTPVAERQSSSFEGLGEGKFNFLQEKMSPPPPLVSTELEWNLATSSHKGASERERHDLWPKSQHFPPGALFHLWSERERCLNKKFASLVDQNNSCHFGCNIK